jgi:hypothetical protein
VTARRISSRKRSTNGSSQKMAGGGCLCGEVAFELVLAAGRLMDCQCTSCRRVQGTAHTANIFVDSAKFRWLRGESQVSNYGPPRDWHYGAAFCRQCGSTLPRVVRSVGIVVVPAGTLDNAPGGRSARHPSPSGARKPAIATNSFRTSALIQSSS